MTILLAVAALTVAVVGLAVVIGLRRTRAEYAGSIERMQNDWGRKHEDLVRYQASVAAEVAELRDREHRLEDVVSHGEGAWGAMGEQVTRLRDSTQQGTDRVLERLAARDEGRNQSSVLVRATLHIRDEGADPTELQAAFDRLLDYYELATVREYEPERDPFLQNYILEADRSWDQLHAQFISALAELGTLPTTESVHVGPRAIGVQTLAETGLAFHHATARLGPLLLIATEGRVAAGVLSRETLGRLDVDLLVREPSRGLQVAAIGSLQDLTDRITRVRELRTVEQQRRLEAEGYTRTQEQGA